MTPTTPKKHIRLSKIDTLILDAMCLDNPVCDVHKIVGESKTFVSARLLHIRTEFNAKTNTGLIFKYGLYASNVKSAVHLYCSDL